MNFNAVKTGKRIRSLRKAKKWSQIDLSDELDICVSYLGRIERGERIAHVWVYMAIAEVFGVSLEYLLDENTSMINQEITFVSLNITGGNTHE